VSETVFTAEEQKALEEKVILPRFFFGPLGVFGIWALAVQWPNDHWLTYALSTIGLTYILFCWTSCFHETAHQTLCSSKRLSVLIGRILGTVMFAPYSVYRESHIRHHAYLNKPTDYELWPYSDPNTSVWFRRVFVWFDLVFGFVMSPFVYGRTYFHKDSPIRSPSLRRTIAYEYVGCVVFWGSVLGLVAWYGAWMGFCRAWLIPHFLAGIYQSARKLTEHLGMASYDPMLGTRTVLGKNLLTRLFTYMNFDIFVHGPHHRHPRVSHNLLGVKMNEYMTEHPQAQFPLYGTYLSATADMLPHMFRNPGVGMNVGAAAPALEKDVDVQNFVGDVSQEVLAETDAQLDR
jgi:fatty acid desaturase